MISVLRVKKNKKNKNVRKIGGTKSSASIRRQMVLVYSQKTHLCTKGALVVEKSILFVHRQVIVALEHTILH